MKIETIKFDRQKIEALRRLEIEAAKRNLYVDYESMKLTTIKPRKLDHWWQEGDQDTPDLYKGEEDERQS